VGEEVVACDTVLVFGTLTLKLRFVLGRMGGSDVPLRKGPKDCAMANSLARGMEGVRADANK
jgi:hypothetical protein